MSHLSFHDSRRHPFRENSLLWKMRSDKEYNTYKDYVVIEQNEINMLRNEVFQKQLRIRKLEEELYYLKNVKYGSFWSTIKAAFRFN